MAYSSHKKMAGMVLSVNMKHAHRPHTKFRSVLVTMSKCKSMYLYTCAWNPSMDRHGHMCRTDSTEVLSVCGGGWSAYVSLNSGF